VSEFISPEPNAILKGGGMSEFVADREREDAFFQPKISLNWQPWGDLSLFAHWAKSFKAGGYNTFAFQGEDSQLGYGPEFTHEWGADAKGTFFDRTLKLNLSAYRMRVDEFQVLTRAPQTGVLGLGLSKVANAPAAQAQGIEGDIIWLAASWLRTYLAFGINDTEFLDFKFNECAPDRKNTDGDGDTRCDATGQPFAFAPKYNGTVAFNLVSPWRPAGLELIGGIGAEYASWAHTDIDLDPRKIQDEYWRFRANVGFGDGRAWSFKVIGENLTDEVTYIRRADLSPKQIFGFPEPPMQVYGQLRWSF
jgi:iron complex outermembrane recepter protein